MEGLQAEVVQLRGLLEAANQQIANANAGVANLAAHLQAPPAPAAAQGARLRVPLESYSHDECRHTPGMSKDQINELSQDNFNTWLFHLTMVATGNGWTVEQTIAAAFASFRGTAARICQSMPRTAADYNNNAEDFIESLRRKLVSPAFSEVARQRFMERRQYPSEDIATFHGQLLSLWTTAFARQDEPWRYVIPLVVQAPYQAGEPAGIRSSKLMEQFLSGLLSAELRKDLRNSVTYGNALDTYGACLERALALEANSDRVRHESNARRAHGPRFQQPLHAGHGAGHGRPEPMEIGALRNQGEDEVPPPVGAVNQAKWCSFHQVNTHSTNDCRMRNQGQATQPRSDDDKKKKSRMRCYICRERGHGINECEYREVVDRAKKRRDRPAQAAAVAMDGRDGEDSVDSESETGWEDLNQGNGQ